MSRARFIAATLLAAGLLAACGSDDGDESTTPTAGGGTEGHAAAVLADALAAGDAIESGTLDLSVLVEVQQTGESGEAGGTLDLHMNGPFENPGGEPPSFALDTTATQENADPAATDVGGTYEGRLISTGEAGYFVFDQYPPLAGSYELDPSLYELVLQVVGAIPNAGSLVSDPQLSEVPDDVEGGENLTHISGELDAASLAAVLESAIRGAGDLGFGVDPAAEVPEGRIEALAQVVESADVDVYIGEDGLVRTIIVNAELSDVDVETVLITIDSEVTGSGEDVVIEAPAETEPLSSFFRKLGKLFAALS